MAPTASAPRGGVEEKIPPRDCNDGLIIALPEATKSPRTHQRRGSLGCSGAVGARKMPKHIRRDVLEELTARTKLKAVEVKALYARFRRLAPNGYLLPAQFRQTMGAIGLTEDPFLPDRMFQVFDLDNDGRLGFKEFATSLAVMIRGSEEEKLQFSFQMAAGGKDGISLEDFQRLIRSCSNTMTSMLLPPKYIRSDEEIERIFYDLSSGDEGDMPSKIDLRTYMAAAQHNEEFLACLGLSTVPGPLERINRGGKYSPKLESSPPPSPTTLSKDRSKGLLTRAGFDALVIEPTPIATSEGSRSDVERQHSDAAPFSGSRPRDLPPAGSAADYIEELRHNVAALRGSMQQRAVIERQDARGIASLWSLSNLSDVSGCAPVMLEAEIIRSGCFKPCRDRSSSSSCNRVGPGGQQRSNGSAKPFPQADEDDDRERWWTPASASRRSPPPSERNLPKQLPASLSGQNPFSKALSSGTLQRCGDEDLGYIQTSLEELRWEIDICLKLCRERAKMHDPNSSSCEEQQLRSVTCLDHRNVHKPEARTSSRAQSPDRRSHEPFSFRRRRHRLLGPKKGLSVHFGHESWNMVLSMMIGIRKSAAHSNYDDRRELQPMEFSVKEKFSIMPQLTNIFDSKVSSSVTMTRFIDYAPQVFQRIRSRFGIQADAYIKSLGPEQLLGNMVLGNLSSLSELHSEGKSGAFFYYTADGCYMIKTVSPEEHLLLKHFLKRYYDHIMQNSGTLIVRFLGLHGLRLQKVGKHFTPSHSTRKVYFVVMANMFNTPMEIHRRYDLKGSWHGRSTKNCYDPSVARKDVDFVTRSEQIKIGPERKEKLMAQLKRDAEFLRDNNIIDYSLLLGVHDVGANSNLGGPFGLLGEDSEASIIKLEPLEEGAERIMQERTMTTFTERTEQERNITALIELERNSMSERAQGYSSMSSNCVPTATPTGRGNLPMHQKDYGGMLSVDKRSLYFVGVIDILTPYGTAKRLEHTFKALRWNWKGVSCCPPGYYSERFLSFMQSHIA